MISKVLVFLRKNIDEYLRSRIGNFPDTELSEDRISFIDGEKMDPPAFKLNAISLLLINIEEEKTLRNADPYTRNLSDGNKQQIQPAIRLNLYILFVAHFKNYEQNLSYLSFIIQFFQNHRLMDQHSFPDLDSSIRQLAIELVTLPFSEQNEIWSALRTAYHPSVLYKVKLVIFEDEDVMPATSITEKNLDIKRIP